MYNILFLWQSFDSLSICNFRLFVGINLYISSHVSIADVKANAKSIIYTVRFRMYDFVSFFSHHLDRPFLILRFFLFREENFDFLSSFLAFRSVLHFSWSIFAGVAWMRTCCLCSILEQNKLLLMYSALIVNEVMRPCWVLISAYVYSGKCVCVIQCMCMSMVTLDRCTISLV